MSQILRKIVTSPGGNRFVGWAENKLNEMERIRLSNGAPKYKKVVEIDGYLIILSCADHELKYIIMGGEGDPQILFATSGAEDGRSDTTYYNYTFDVLEHAIKAQVKGELHPFVDGSCHLGDLGDARFHNKKWSAAVHQPPITSDHLAVMPWYEVELQASGQDLYARTFSGVKKAGTVEGILEVNLTETHRNGVGVMVTPSETSLWNLYSGPSLYYFDPVAKNYWDDWIWIPSMFSVGYDYSPDGLTHGFYYGAQEDQWSPLLNARGFPADLESANFKLLAMCETKERAMTKPLGWAEMVLDYKHLSDTSVVIPSDAILFFQTDLLPEWGRDTYYYENTSSTATASSITVYNGMPGHGSLYVGMTRAKTPGVPPDEVKLWSYNAYVAPPQVLDTSAMGCIIVEGGVARLLRVWGKTVYAVHECTNFHSYSVGQNGRIVAIFEGPKGGEITGVRVFDMRGTREDLKTPAPGKPVKYVSSAPQELRYRIKDIAALKATSACIIPFREKNAQDEEIVPQAFDIRLMSTKTVRPADRAEMPSLGALYFDRDGSSSMVIRKLTAQGPLAAWEYHRDECFDSRVVVDDQFLRTERDRLHAMWYQPHNRGLIRGDFVRTGVNQESMIYQGTGHGDFFISTLNPTIHIGQALDGTWLILGAVGTVTTTCLEWSEEQKALIVDSDCYDAVACNGGDVTISATSSCGQYGAVVDTVPPPTSMHYENDPAGFSCEDEGVVTPGTGKLITITGGLPPWEFTPSCGSVVDGVLNTDGCCGQVDMIATSQRCGTSVRMPAVRAASGQWVADSDCGTISGYCVENDFTCNEGGTSKTYTVYHGDTELVEFFCPDDCNCVPFPLDNVTCYYSGSLKDCEWDPAAGAWHGYWEVPSPYCTNSFNWECP